MNTKEVGPQVDMIGTNDVRKFLGEMGMEKVDSDEIEKFLKDIGFAEDQVCQVEDFAKFLLE